MAGCEGRDLGAVVDLNLGNGARKEKQEKKKTKRCSEGKSSIYLVSICESGGEIFSQLSFFFFVLSWHLNCEQRQTGEGKNCFVLLFCFLFIFYDDLGLEFYCLSVSFDF